MNTMFYPPQYTPQANEKGSNHVGFGPFSCVKNYFRKKLSSVIIHPYTVLAVFK
jgi:hypothetical protein